MNNTNSLRKLMAAAVLALAPAAAAAAWEQQAIDVGGPPGLGVAISSATSKAYLPLLQQRALSISDGANWSRMDLDVIPTSIAYSAATGRFFVGAMFDDAVIVIDEATGTKTRLAGIDYPDKIIVDDARGKVFVMRFAGAGNPWTSYMGTPYRSPRLDGGGLAIIDTATLAVTNVTLSGAMSGMVYDPATGRLFMTGEGSGRNSGFLVALDTSGRAFRRVDLNAHQMYSLAVDSRTGRVYVAGLENPPFVDPDNTNRLFRIYDQDLRLLQQQLWPSGGDWRRLNFLIDPAAPGFYLGSMGSNYLLRLDGDGGNLQIWNTGLGNTQVYDGREVIAGVNGLDADPVTGQIFVSAGTGGRIAVFTPPAGAMELIGIPGTAGFNGVNFWGNRVLLLDAAGETQVTVLERN